MRSAFSFNSGKRSITSERHRSHGSVVIAHDFTQSCADSISLDLHGAHQEFHARDEGVGFLYCENFLELQFWQAIAAKGFVW